MNRVHKVKQEDLRFLYLLDALYQERGVSRAADRLGLTQPAVSHGLNRMRLQFDDALFVRSGAGMAPTPLGERLALAARRVLELVQSEIWEGESFSPTQSDRVFTVGMTDMGGTVILPKVVHALGEASATVRIRPVAVRPTEVNTLLEKGVIDLAWGYFGDLSEKLFQQTLFRRSFVGIIRRGDPAASTMDFNTFVQRAHVFASVTTFSNELLQRTVKARGRKLQVALEVPYLMAIPGIVAGTSYLATVPDEVAEIFLRIADIQTFVLPLPIPAISVQQYWHARYNDDAAHKWFRATVRSCFAKV